MAQIVLAFKVQSLRFNFFKGTLNFEHGTLNLENFDLAFVSFEQSFDLRGLAN